MVGLALSEAGLVELGVGEALEALAVVVEAEPDGEVLVDEVGHVAVDEAVGLLLVAFADQQAPPLLGSDGHLLVVVEDVDVGRASQVAELVVEQPFVLVVPA
jgi:hypothetical protein